MDAEIFEFWSWPGYDRECSAQITLNIETEQRVLGSSVKELAALFKEAFPFSD
jgi:hypothetical protein